MDNNNNIDDEDNENIWRFEDIKSQGYDVIKIIRTTYAQHTGQQQHIYQCLLCDPTGKIEMDKDQLSNHRKDQHHSTTVSKLSKKQENRKIELLEIDKMSAGLFEHIRCVPASIHVCLADCFVGGKASKQIAIKEVEQLCTYYKKNEPLVLLELALWKAACFLNLPKCMAADSMISYFFRGGWKKNKAASRHDPLIGSVISNVLQFLGLE